MNVTCHPKCFQSSKGRPNKMTVLLKIREGKDNHGYGHDHQGMLIMIMTIRVN